MIDSEQYREGNGEIVIQEGKIEKLLKFKIYKLLKSYKMITTYLLHNGSAS